MRLIQPNSTYLLLNYTIPCDGVVHSWEFCYFTTSTNPITFYPSVWRPVNANTHTLVNVNRVTATGSTTGCQCLNYTVPDYEQFDVSAGDIVGLYSNTNSQLIAKQNDSARLYIYLNHNQSGTVDNTGRFTRNEMIAIKVYISKWSYPEV